MSLVLDYLKQPPFEPIRKASLKHLTMKTAFLVTLASARRGSEVHALAGSPESYAFERDGEFASHFVEDFVAKTKNQELSPRSLILH